MVVPVRWNGRLQGRHFGRIRRRKDRTGTLARTIYEGYGREPGVNPHYRFYYKTGFNGGEPVLLTPGNGEHSVAFSPDGRFLTDTWSRMDRARHRVCGMKASMSTGRATFELCPRMARTGSRAGWGS